MIDINLLRYSRFFMIELIAACPYDTHTMQNSIHAITINDNIIDVLIPVSYASHVNGGKEIGGNSDKHKGWVESVANRVSKCYSENVNDIELRTGIKTSVLMGQEE